MTKIINKFFDLFHYRNKEDIIGTENTETRKDIDITEEYVLNKKLKHLEFINHLENNISDFKLHYLSVDLLKAIEKHKLESQVTVINTAKRLLLKSA